MYRVMVIDDEQSARNLLKVSIDWKSLGMEVTGEAASGIEAINIIDEVCPDIAFVDISMPFMNGIEFTKLATERYPNLIIIILTAFDEFSYAQQCIRLPVFDYMLKPVVRDDIYEVLSRAKELLDKTRSDATDEGLPEIEEESSIELIKKYINEHFCDSSINLTSVAMEFGFSSSYLSRKFKNEVGCNFVEYLTSCRMKKAMDLASANKKMFCAADEVGIPDPNYFGKCFKKYAGMSYSEYIQSLKDKA